MTQPAPDPEAVRAALHDAVSGALSQFGEFPTRFVILVESIGGDSETGLWSTVAKDQKAWDTMGLLTFALAQEQAAVTQRAIDGE